MGEALLQLRALHLPGRRDRLALDLGIELPVQDAKRLHLLDAPELRVVLLEFAADELDDRRVGGERGVARVEDVVGPRPLGDGAYVDLDERREVASSIADDGDLAD